MKRYARLTAWLLALAMLWGMTPVLGEDVLPNEQVFEAVPEIEFELEGPEEPEGDYYVETPDEMPLEADDALPEEETPEAPIPGIEEELTDAEESDDAEAVPETAPPEYAGGIMAAQEEAPGEASEQIPGEGVAIQLNVEAAELGVGETLALWPAHAGIAEEEPLFTYTSTDSAVAAVSETGVIKGVSLGEADIVVDDGASSAICHVTVKNAPASVKLPSTLSMGNGDTLRLNPTLPEGSASKLTFKSGKASVASVDDSGLVTAKARGKAKITVTTFNKKTATVEITVNAAPGTVTLSPKSANLGVNETLKLKATLTKNTSSTLEYTSDNPNVAAVNASGAITALAPGEAVITVRTFNDHEDSCTLRVFEEPVTLALNLTEDGVLGVGESVQLTALMTSAQGGEAGGTLTYTSSNTRLATVDASGKVKAKKAGSAWVTITAKTYNGLTAQWRVKVVKAPKSVKLNASKVTLGYDAQQALGAQYRLKATLPSGTSSAIRYSSDNTEVAVVDEGGCVTAVGVGTAKITAQAFNGKKATCTVTVKAAPDWVAAVPESLLIGQGDSRRLSAEIPVDTASDITYTSTDETIASVDALGNVRAESVGETQILLTTFNGRQAGCDVKVVPAPTEIRLAPDVGATLGVGESLALDAVPLQEDGEISSASIKWKTSSAKVATVNAEGKITSKKAGSATITATAYNGVSASFKVKVVKAPKSLTLSPAKRTLGYDGAIGLGEQFTLTAKLPAGTSSAITYDGYDPAVISVNTEGLVTALSAGTTTVTAHTFNKKTAKCAVTVMDAPQELGMDHEAITLGAGAMAKIAAVLPADTASAITYASSDEAVVAVDAAGKLTAVAEGTATVTARAFNGVDAECHVTVVPAPTTLAVTPVKLTLGVGEKSAPLRPEVDVGELYGGYTYSSSNTRVAKVSADGVVTAVKKGSATIKVSTYNGLKFSVSVSVSEAPKSVTLSPKTLKLYRGQTSRVKPTFPKGQTGGVTYESEDSSVVQVDADGGVTAVGKGSARLCATTYNGKKGYCEVQVIAEAGRVELVQSANIVAHEPVDFAFEIFDVDGDAYQGDYTVTFEPVGAAQYTGGRLVGKAAGAAVMTVTAGEVSAACDLTIAEYKSAHTTQSIAHRGASGYYPENTLEAFRQAKGKGAEGVELDVRTTKDGVQIIHHDATFTVGKTKYTISQLTYAQIKKLKSSVCTLDEAVKVIKDSGLDLHLEMKDNANGKKCVDIVRANGMQNRTVYFSFYDPQLKQVYAAEPSARLGKSLKTSPSNAETKKLKDSLHLSFLVASRLTTTQQNVDDWHEMGLKVCIWTVNDKTEARKFCNMGVDYILSNYPDYVVNAR